MPSQRMLITMGAAGVAVAVLGRQVYVELTRVSKSPDYASRQAKNNPWFVREDRHDKAADVFYVHPTTQFGIFRWNMAWEDMPDSGVCTGPIAGDPDLMNGQAGAWRDSCNLWAPKYREMGFMAQLQNLETADDALLEKVKASFDQAYDDVERAFKHFLENRQQDRPFFVAGHSQGAVLLSKVLAQHVEGTEYERYFVAGYLCGGYVPMDLFGGERGVFESIKPCAGPTDTNCVIAYDTRTTTWKPESLNTFGLGFGVWPHHMHWLLHDRYCDRPKGTDDTSKPRLQISPLTWSTEGGGQHLGVHMSYKKGGQEPAVPPPGWSDGVTVSDKGVLVPDPESWLPGAGNAGGPGNMHPIDVHFWYHNIRANVRERLAAWEEQAAAE